VGVVGHTTPRVLHTASSRHITDTSGVLKHANVEFEALSSMAHSCMPPAAVPIDTVRGDMNSSPVVMHTDKLLDTVRAKPDDDEPLMKDLFSVVSGTTTTSDNHGK
jgi:hypothetical protein